MTKVTIRYRRPSNVFPIVAHIVPQMAAVAGVMINAPWLFWPGVAASAAILLFDAINKDGKGFGISLASAGGTATVIAVARSLIAGG